MEKRDYYDVLGVNKNVDSDTLKKAYRRLAMKYHPDRNPGEDSETKFKELQEAYNCLSDGEKRAAYDRFGHAALEGGGMHGGAGNGFSSFFDDAFSELFGARTGARQQRVLDITVSFEEMVTGCQKNIRVDLPQSCQHCDGNGAEPGSRVITCSTCDGSGQARIQRGFFTIQQTCPRCRGNGRTIEKACQVCHGDGRVVKSRNLSVNIPAGIEGGSLIRINTKGHQDEELFLRPNIRPHPLFNRDGDNLHIEIPISMVTAILGGEMDIPSVNEGKVTIKIPAGIQSTQVLRIPGRGIPNVQSKRRGNIMCHIVVETPVKLSEDQKDLLRQFEDSLKNKHSPKEKSWLDKVKNLFAE